VLGRQSDENMNDFSKIELQNSVENGNEGKRESQYGRQDNILFTQLNEQDY